MDVVFLVRSLSLLSGVAQILIFLYAWLILEACIKWMVKKEKPNWNALSPFGMFGTAMKSGPSAVAATCVVLILVFGFGFEILRHICQNTVIGSVWEMREYEENYEAVLYIDGKPICCIVELERREDRAEDGHTQVWYGLNKLSLPYGRHDYLDDEEYEPGESNAVYVREVQCEIELSAPASAASFELLKNTVVSRSGNWCASVNTTTFHHIDCLQAKNILHENKVFFESEAEAYVLGFDACANCGW